MLSKIWKWISDLRYRGKSYEIPLNELIDLAVDRMKRETGYTKLICPQCFLQRGVKSPMDFRTSKIVVDVVPIRDDQAYKCTWCFYTEHHGIPINRVEANTEIRLRGGSPWLMKPTYRPDERNDEAVLKRLRDLGYIE